MFKRPFIRLIVIFKKEDPPPPYATGVITYFNFAVYAGLIYPHRTKKGVSNYTHTHREQKKKDIRMKT